MPPLRRTLTLANIFDENQYLSEQYNANLPSTAQPHTTVFNLPATTTPFPRRSSPLGLHQHTLPGRPVFPPSIRKPDFYRQALKRSFRQAQRAKRYMKNI
jgi:hypothetical protein